MENTLLGKKREDTDDQSKNHQQHTPSDTDKPSANHPEPGKTEPQETKHKEPSPHPDKTLHEDPKKTSEEENKNHTEKQEKDNKKEENKNIFTFKSPFSTIIPKSSNNGTFLDSSADTKNTKSENSGLFKTSGSLFSGKTEYNFSMFTSEKNFFTDKKEEKKENHKENEAEEEDVFGEEEEEEEKPKKEKPVPLASQDFSKFNKLFSKFINSMYVFNLSEKKYISKGKGFLSVETSNEESLNKTSCVVFRNQMGTKIVEGYITDKIHKIDATTTSSKKYVANFSYVTLEESNPKFGAAKAVFMKEEEMDEFKKSYEKAVEFITVKESEDKKE